MNWKLEIKQAFKAILSKSNSRHRSQNNLSNYDRKRLNILVKRLNNEDYQFSEWKPSSQPKKDGGQRIIIIPPFYDRIVLRTLASYISKRLKPSFAKVDNISFAYQKGKGVREALIQLKNLYASVDVILKVDIRKFFDNIDKEIVAALLNDYNIHGFVRSLIDQSLSPKLKINDFYDDALTQIDNGIPQGNAISAVLSNLMLLELDMQSKNNGFKMVRYADDMVFICKDIDEAYSILSWVKNYLKSQRNLEIHSLSFEKDAKTQIKLDIKKNKLKFLGVEFDGERLLPTKECQGRFIAKIISVVKSTVSTAEEIAEINTCISQWCGYYAFTDIPDTRLRSLSKKINKLCNSAFNDSAWESVDLLQKIKKFREKQSRKGLKRILPPAKFDDKYKWLMVYD